MVPLQHLPAARQGLQLVLLWAQSDRSQLRRRLQRSGNPLPPCAIQRKRERILQTVQLQKLSQRTLLQRDPPRHDKVPPQNSPRFLLNLGRHLLLAGFCIYVLELVYVIPDKLNTHFSTILKGGLVWQGGKKGNGGDSLRRAGKQRII
jgi:hypothetical protein